MLDIEKIQEKINDIEKEQVRMDSKIENIAEQQSVIATLVESVQNLALSLRELTVETKSNSKRLKSIEEDKNKKNYYVWTVVVGGVFGAVITWITSVIF